MKYAAGHNAKRIIWFVNQQTPEVIETAHWLSNYLSFDMKFHIIKCCLNANNIEFEELLHPPENAYKPNIKITKTKEKQAQFWQEFDNYTKENSSPVKISHPAPQHWQYVPIGMAGVSIQLTVNTNRKNLGCELLIAKDKELFYKLEEFKDDIENQLGKLDWQALEGKKSSRIKMLTDFDIENENGWNDGFKWMIENADRFKDVFVRYLK